mgnify:FL=1
MSETENSFATARSEIFGFIWEILKVVVISLAIIIPVRYFLVQPFFVRGASMQNTFMDGDYILIDEISYRFREPQRGDAVVFKFPEDHTQFFIKRIIGLPGETVEVVNNKVIVYIARHPNGMTLDESAYLSSTQRTNGTVKTILRNDQYFVLGDNRLQSSDSRYWGSLSRDLIIGRVFSRAWPLNKIELFHAPLYTFQRFAPVALGL